MQPAGPLWFGRMVGATPRAQIAGRLGVSRRDKDVGFTKNAAGVLRRLEDLRCKR